MIRPPFLVTLYLVEKVYARPTLILVYHQHPSLLGWLFISTYGFHSNSSDSFSFLIQSLNIYSLHNVGSIPITLWWGGGVGDLWDLRNLFASG